MNEPDANLHPLQIDRPSSPQVNDSTPAVRLKSTLPRLDPAFYRGTTFIHWTLTIENRAKGWLTPSFHVAWQLTLLHTCARYRLACPSYVLMPNHVHLLTMGLSGHSDHRTAIEFLRKHLRPKLAPADWQHQAHDHVLREYQRKRGVFDTVAHYILENPVRAGLVDSFANYPFLGCSVPGYPSLDICQPDFWEKFWRIYQRLVTADQHATADPLAHARGYRE